MIQSKGGLGKGLTDNKSYKYTVREHITEYRDSKKLKPENGGSTEKLSLKQSELIIGNLRILDQQCLVFFQHWRHLGLTQS